jgi:hypothetical protein
MTYEFIVSLDMLVNGETYRQDCFKVLEDEEKECANDLLMNSEEYMEGIRKSIMKIYKERKDREERKLGEGKFEEIIIQEDLEEEMDYEDFLSEFQREMEEKTIKCQQNMVKNQSNRKEHESLLHSSPEEKNERRYSQQEMKCGKNKEKENNRDEGILEEILKISEGNNDHKQSQKRKRSEDDDDIRVAKRKALIEDIVNELVTSNEELSTKEQQSDETIGIIGIWNEFNKAVASENNGIEYWYRYAERFRKEIKKREEQGKQRKKPSHQVIREEIYNDLVKLSEGKTGKLAIKRRTHRAEKIYKLFSQIGEHKIHRIRSLSMSDFRDLNEEEMEEIVTMVMNMEEE